MPQKSYFSAPGWFRHPSLGSYVSVCLSLVTIIEIPAIRSDKIEVQLCKEYYDSASDSQPLIKLPYVLFFLQNLSKFQNISHRKGLMMIDLTEKDLYSKKL